MGDQHMAVAVDPGRGGDGVGPDAHEGGMADGDQAGESGDQVQSDHRHHGDQDVVDHQHVLVADLEKQGPDKERQQKKAEKQRGPGG